MSPTTKLKEPPCYHLSGVPNNRVGQRFMAQLRKYLNRDTHKVRVYFNGPRAEAAKADGFVSSRKYQSYLPKKHATSMRVYFDQSDAARERQNAKWRANPQPTTWELQHELKIARADREEYRQHWEHEKGERDCARNDLNLAREIIDEQVEALRVANDAAAMAREDMEVAQGHAVDMDAEMRDLREQRDQLQRQLNAVPMLLLTIIAWARSIRGGQRGGA